MIIPVLLGIGVFASVVLIFRRSGEGESAQERAIRERLISEIGDEMDRSRGPLAGALRPLVRWNAALRLYRRKGLMEETVVTGKVPLSAAEFFALKELSAVAGAALYMCAAGAGGVNLMLPMSAAFGWMLPDIWLRQQIARRHRLIARDLPEVVDLLDRKSVV